MFGYVLPVKAEMKVKDFETYRAHYCGVCKQLQKSHGLFSRFLLNYDLVLLALVADALSGDAGTVKQEGCFANPLANRATCHDTPGLALAADGLVMLSHHRVHDAIQDERGIKQFLYTLVAPFMHRKYKKAAKRRPLLAVALEEQMQRQRQLEAERCASIDAACDPTAKMCEALFAEAAQSASQQKIVSRLGLFAGQIVYLLDAAEDFVEDNAKGRYNVFIQSGLSFAEAVEAAQVRCRMAAGEIALSYNLLNIVQYKPILDNIFFLGLPSGIHAAGKKRTRRILKHGQIESI